MGDKNPRWSGGKSEYPNHRQMQKNRLIKLKETGGKCEVCGEDAFCIHHIDEQKDNHSLENLAALCYKCHNVFHADRKARTSKYIREYGLTLKEMAKEYGGSMGVYHNLHRNGKLHSFLEEKGFKRVS